MKINKLTFTAFKMSVFIAILFFAMIFVLSRSNERSNAEHINVLEHTRDSLTGELWYCKHKHDTLFEMTKHK